MSRVFKELVPGKYDALLVDQFGVLHDGNTPFEGVMECLKGLVDASVKLILLSNSTKKSQVTKDRMVKKKLLQMPEAFSEMVTSGELVWRMFDTQSPEAKKLGRKCFVIDVGDDAAPDFFKGLISESQFHATESSGSGNGNSPAAENDGRGDDNSKLEIVNFVEEADFILCVGAGALLTMPGFQLEKVTSWPSPRIDEALKKASERDLKLLCMNPDLISAPRLDGSFDYVGGSVAKRYEEEFDGNCLYVGKPYAVMYDEALRLLEEKYNITDKSRIAMVGDSLMHDIAGAKGAGICSLWLQGGVHHKELGVPAGPSDDKPNEEALEPLYERYNCRPTHLVKGFCWE